jgi:hypoxanthine phosphoribosyltransferase
VSLKIVTWDEYTGLLDKLSNDIALRHFDAIVTIGRGGCMIGAFLASKLGIPTVTSVFVRHVGRGANLRIEVTDLGKVQSLRGSLLVVDDWLVEGRAMTFVLDRIPKGASITTLVMFNRKGSKFTPDIVGAYVKETEREILFPYDVLG